ncbi:MAG TPA: LuxR C-terminal-related transcriptional regulator [Methylomirabilota bacterium]|nr:LuxR C-terminal-related transcriptional regulator [Methylomirabilota bacterium]
MVRLDQNSLLKALNRAGDGVVVADGEGRVVLWNRAAERLLGWSAPEAVGRTSCELLDARNDGRPCGEACPIRAAARKGDAVESFDVRARAKAGREIRLNVSTLAVPAEPGAEAFAIYLFRDVSTRTPATNGTVIERPPMVAENGVPLTRREREVLRLLSTGANTRTAAERLGVSPATIRNHVQNLLGKLGVHSRLQAVAYATTHGLL